MKYMSVWVTEHCMFLSKAGRTEMVAEQQQGNVHGLREVEVQVQAGYPLTT